MTTRRREFIDRLLRISELNDELLELGDKNRQPAYTKRIKLIQMGKAEFNLPLQPPPPSLPHHNCKILVIDRPINRYNSQKPNSVKTAELAMNETPQISPTTQEERSLFKMALNKRKTSQTINDAPNENINFVVPVRQEARPGTAHCLGDRSKRPQSQQKSSRKVVSSAKNILFAGGEGESLHLISPKDNIGRMISGKSIKFHRGNTLGTQRYSKADEQRKSKLQKMKQISKNYAGPFIPPPKISAKSYIICEIKPEGIKPVICYNSKNSQEVASLTKIMTCLLAIQLSEQTKTDMGLEEIKIGKYESSIGGTSAELRPGQIYTLKQLLYGLMLPSGNDASLALAVWGGRKLFDLDISEIQSTDQVNLSPKRTTKSSCYTRFLQQMNQKAKTLGMAKTKYANSHGLANPNNRSTAYDIALLSHYAMQNSIFKEIVSCRVFESTIKVEQASPKRKMNNFYEEHSQPELDEQIDDQSSSSPSKRIFNSSKTILLTSSEKMDIRWQNTHKLLQSRPQEYIGIKTGVTTTAGPCLSSLVAVEDRQFIIIVLACAKIGLRFKETEILKRWLFKHEGLNKRMKKMSSLKPQKMTEEGESESEASWGNQQD